MALWTQKWRFEGYLNIDPMCHSLSLCSGAYVTIDGAVLFQIPELLFKRVESDDWSCKKQREPSWHVATGLCRHKGRRHIGDMPSAITILTRSWHHTTQSIWCVTTIERTLLGDNSGARQPGVFFVIGEFSDNVALCHIICKSEEPSTGRNGTSVVDKYALESSAQPQRCGKQNLSACVWQLFDTETLPSVSWVVTCKSLEVWLIGTRKYQWLVLYYHEPLLDQHELTWISTGMRNYIHY